MGSEPPKLTNSQIELLRDMTKWPDGYFWKLKSCEKLAALGLSVKHHHSVYGRCFIITAAGRSALQSASDGERK